MKTGMESRIQELASQGKTIVQICRALGLDWREVRSYLHTVDKRSWRGAKVVITNRLNMLAKEGDPAKREQLAAEAGQRPAPLCSMRFAMGAIDNSNQP